MSGHIRKGGGYECEANQTLWLGPIQGSEHSDLVSYSAQCLDKMGFDIFGLGSPVELMEAYEFAKLSQMIFTMKRSVPAKPIHLFGAGHPLTIPLVIALGCDTFDSASYILYAKDNRYMHPNGTLRLEQISYFPCSCSICSEYTVHEMLALDLDKRTVELAKHNLHVLRAEVCAVKEAIMQGRLWEYVMQKAHAHPKLFDAIQLFKNFNFLEEGTPLFKDKALLLFDAIDQYRPEVTRFRKIVSDFRSKNKKKLILYPESDIHPFYCTKEYRDLIKKFTNAQICTYNPFLGVIPSEICDIYPASHNLIPKSVSLYPKEDYPTFTESLNKFLRSNHFEEIIIIADSFMRNVIDGKDNMLIKELHPQILDHKKYNASQL
jgi:7-cyano-7-deazaguanine tRNA-ribosyltransferase